MNIKSDRINKIKSFLRMQSGPVSVTEIHEALTKRVNLDVSRKTIERDMIELTENKAVSTHPGVPVRYFLSKPLEVELSLKVEEVQHILQVIDQKSELFSKLTKLLNS